jgi:hypothetical protein
MTMADAGDIMDRAASADRRALFAALQAALVVITDLCLRPKGDAPLDQHLGRVAAALDLGAEYGSPEHIEHSPTDPFRISG